MWRSSVFVLCAFGLAGSALAEKNPLNLSGQVDLGYRYYFDDGIYPGQAPGGFHPFAGFQLNGNTSEGDGELVFKFTGLSDDALDRSIFNIQKAYYTHSFDNWDIVLGYNVENWGVSNGRTIVNVLNAKNQSNQIANSDLIGTPMLNANVFTGVGTFSFYLLGDDVKNNFGGRATRQRGPFHTDDRLIRYEDNDSTDVALRYTHNLPLGDGSLDISASAFHGTNRQALRLPGCIAAETTVTSGVCDSFNADILAGFESGAALPQGALAAAATPFTALTPYYQEIRQYGMTAVYARDDLQLRFEGFVRNASNEDFGAAIIGGDYSFQNFMGSDGTLIAALEYHYDDRSTRQPTTVYDDDLFLGLNFNANNTNDSRLEFGVFYDLDAASQIYSLSMSRRFGDRTRVSLNASHINADNTADPLSAVDGNSYIEFSLSTFF